MKSLILACLMLPLNSFSSKIVTLEKPCLDRIENFSRSMIESVLLVPASVINVKADRQVTVSEGLPTAEVQTSLTIVTERDNDVVYTKSKILIKNNSDCGIYSVEVDQD